MLNARADTHITISKCTAPKTCSTPHRIRMKIASSQLFIHNYKTIILCKIDGGTLYIRCSCATWSWLIMIVAVAWRVMVATMIMMTTQLFQSLSLSRHFWKKTSTHTAAHTDTHAPDSQIAVWIVVAVNLLDVRNIIVFWLTSSVATFMHYFTQTRTHTHARSLSCTSIFIAANEMHNTHTKRCRIYLLSAAIPIWESPKCGRSKHFWQ